MKTLRPGRSWAGRVRRVEAKTLRRRTKLTENIISRGEAARRYERSSRLHAEALGLIPGVEQSGAGGPDAITFGAYPMYLQRAKGCRVEDVDGHTYIDLTGAGGSILLGYGYPAVHRAVMAQLDRGIVAGLPNPLEAEAARLVTEMVPCAEMVRFFRHGREAITAAIRLARAQTGREFVLTNRRSSWPPQAKDKVVGFPFSGLPALEKLFVEHSGNVAAVVLDIVDTAPAPSYLQAVCDLTHQHGALFTMDEVITGFRFAPGGAQEYFGVKPDLACFGEAMANGMPLAAIAGRTEVMRLVTDLPMPGPHVGDALSLAATVACLKEIREHKVAEHIWRIGRKLMEGFSAAASENGIALRSSGLAPVFRLEFDGLTGKEEQLTWDFLLQEMATRGVRLSRKYMQVVSYSHSDEDAARIVGAARGTFAALRPLWRRSELAEHVHVLHVKGE
jgi:glutamate-1-semialdehyde aminotransferase